MENFYILTPFKNNVSINLLDTIKSIKSLELKIRIIHIVIFDSESIEVINKIKSNYLKNFKSKLYFVKFILAPKKGIYCSINIGLDQVSNDGFYIVLGEGDIIKQKSKNFKLKKNQIQILDYKLSNKNKIINQFRNIYSGMPYCHNAIIFKKNDLRYLTRFKISSDYHYLLKYVENNSIKIKKDIVRNNGLEIVFEASSGISSKSIIRKNLENILILIKLKRLIGLFIYLTFLFPKFINRCKKII